MRCLARTASAMLLVAGAASAQLKETIEVHLVEVPVTVVDRGGNPVRGLTAANFEIFDQGSRREITNFDRIDYASPESMKATSPLNPNARRSFLLLFDLSFSSPVGRTKAQEAARNFIARGMLRRDLAAVATVDVNHGFRLVTAFTTDRTLLTAAIANPQTFVASDPLQIAGSTVFDVQQDTRAPTIEQPTTRAGNDFAADIARMDRRLLDTYKRDRVERQLLLLNTLAQTCRRLPGRKQVIFFTEGFDPRLVQGRDPRDVAAAQDDLQETTSGNMWRVDTDARYGSSTSISILGEMARVFRSADVVLHTVDIQGVRVQNDVTEGSRINSNDALHLLSQPTGGEVFKNTNNINADLADMMRRQEVIYVLGFRTQGGGDGKFHAIKVKVNGAPGAQLFHRAGYYDSGAQTALERSLSAAEIILNDIPQNDIRVATLAAPFPTPGSTAVVPVVVDINGADVLKHARSGVVNAEVYLYAFDEEGIVRDRMFERIAVDLSKVGDKLTQSGVKYVATLSLPPGKYALKTLVRTADDRKGFVRTDIDVPSEHEITLLPPLFMDDPSRWVMVRGGSHAGQAPYPFHINGEPFVPSASVEMEVGSRRQFAIFVINAAADELALETALTDAYGQSHAGAPSLMKELQGEQALKFLYEYAPGDLRPGSGTFDITMRKKGSADTRKSSVPLVVPR